MSSADMFILNNSMEAQQNEFIFEKKEMVYTIDSNNSSYPNGVIQFDCSALSNCGRLCDFRNSTLVIPTVLRVTGNALDDNAQNAFAASWKNHCHAIDSMTVQMSNHSVVEPCEFSNIPCSFKLLTEMSQQELQQYGYSIGFFKDNALSLGVNIANNEFAALGYETNNRVNYTGGVAVADGRGHGDANINTFSGNPALMARMANTSLDLTGAPLAYTSGFTDVGKSICVRTADNLGGGVFATVVYHGLITLPLRFLNDFFDKLPLIRNSYFKMSITTNLISRSTVTFDQNNAQYTSVTHALSAKCVPYNLSVLGAGWKRQAAGAGQTLTVESTIGRFPDGLLTNPTLQSCRIYTPTYTLTPTLEDRYFSQGPKQILYSSYYRAVTPIIKTTESLNSFLVTNGLSRIRSILIMPVSAGYINGNNDLVTLNNFTNPWTSCPTTTAPYAFLKHFNVRIGGSPHYSENIFYSWQTFQEEICARGLNGNLEFGLGSGLLNQLEWNAAYRFIYVDLSRKPGQGQDDVSKSIHLDGTNSSGAPMQYHIFVEYQKSINVDLSTGQLVIV